MDRIFGYTEEQIRKLSGKRNNNDVDPQYRDLPIRPGETWDASLRGSKKILNDPELRKRMHDIYRS